MSLDVLLQVKNIDVTYDNLQVLWDISREVRSGEVVAIAGANGAGKSTLLKTISGVLHPSKGSIEFAGKDITELKPYDIVTLGISQVPEGKQLFPEMTLSVLALKRYIPLIQVRMVLDSTVLPVLASSLIALLLLLLQILDEMTLSPDDIRLIPSWLLWEEFEIMILLMHPEREIPDCWLLVQEFPETLL